MQKAIAFLLCTLLFASCSKKSPEPTASQDQAENAIEQYTPEEDFEIKVLQKGEWASITKYIGKSKNVNIPPYIQGSPIISIGEKAFFNMRLTSVTIPDTVKYINDYAFASNELTEIIIPDGIRDIDKGAFQNNSLTHVTVPASVGESAFESNRLTDVELLAGVGSIGDRAFYGNNLTSITIPETIWSIGESAFEKNKLVNVEIPNTVTWIEKKAFYNNNLIEISIPNTVTRIDEYAFAQNKFSFITIPDSLFVGKENMIKAFELGSKFNDYYLENGAKAGTYTLADGEWTGILIERQVFETDGTYKIIAAYSHLYNAFATKEIETKKLGMKLAIHNDKIVFEDMEYQITNNNGYGKDTDGIIPYRKFLMLFVGMNYGEFNEDIIGKDYTGFVKAMTMKNDTNKFDIFFADNKLIIEIYADKYETEFAQFIIANGSDCFFYIAEKVSE